MVTLAPLTALKVQRSWLQPPFWDRWHGASRSFLLMLRFAQLDCPSWGLNPVWSPQPPDHYNCKGSCVSHHTPFDHQSTSSEGHFQAWVSG